MKTRLVLLLVVLACPAGLGVFAWREHARAEEATRTRAAIVVSLKAAQSERGRVEARLAVAPLELAKHQEALAKLPTAVRTTPEDKTAAAAAAASTTDMKGADPWEQIIRRDPTLQAARLAAERARLAIDYVAFFRERGLTPEQIRRFEQNMLAMNEAEADIDAAIESQRLAEDDASIERLRGDAHKKFTAAQIALLGAEGFKRALEFRESISLRNTARGLAVAALDAGLPFSVEQTEQLAATFVTTGQRSPQGDGITPDWNAAYAQLATILSPEQLAFIQRVEPNTEGASTRFFRELQEAVRAARRADGGKK